MLYIVSGRLHSPGINLKELTYWSYLVYYPQTPVYYIGALKWFGCEIWNQFEDRFWKAWRSVE